MTETQSGGDTFDIVVLGSGTGGYSAALRASDLGMRVAIIERDRLGGTCLNRGCIPTKALLHAAELADGAREARERWGVQTTVGGVDYSVLAAARDDIVEKNVRGLTAHLKQDGVTVIRGNGVVAGPREVVVDGVQRLHAERALVLATGSVPRPLEGISIDGEHVITSDHALLMDRLPRSAIVVGAGSVGVEFASFWAAFGVPVTVVEALPSLLPHEDLDVGRELGRALGRRGIQVRTGASLERVEVEGDVTRVTLRTAPQPDPEELEAEVVLIATGRRPVTKDIGLESLGVELDRGYVVPRDWERLETSVKGVHVVGDLLPPPSLALAHASFAEGLRVAEVLAGRPTPVLHYPWVPRVTYTSPEVACVGLTEEQARQDGRDVVTNRMPFAAVARGLIIGRGGFVKVVQDRREGEVVGIHMVGAHVSEMVSEAMLIVGWQADPSDVARLIHPHPTLSEAIGEAHLTLADRRLHQIVLTRAGTRG
jgi:dihydrolipoamide dehydrogenase